LTLKGIQHNFKFHLNAIELYKREEWIDKGFVLNISRFLFDSIILLLNGRLFLWIFSTGHFPLYLLGESFDTFIKLVKSVQMFMKSRKLVQQIQGLPGVRFTGDMLDGEQAADAGADSTCIICLDEMTVGKKLPCGHVFHVMCLRGWIEQHVKCPTCRDEIDLDGRQQ
jgi:E3 ubiquitin-protein ligase synoviolin